MQELDLTFRAAIDNGFVQRSLRNSLGRLPFRLSMAFFVPRYMLYFVHILAGSRVAAMPLPFLDGSELPAFSFWASCKRTIRFSRSIS